MTDGRGNSTAPGSVGKTLKNGWSPEELYVMLRAIEFVEDARLSRVIWARVKGYPSWPAQILTESAAKKKLAKVVQRRDHTVPVVFFGTSEIAWVMKNDVNEWGDGLKKGHHTKNQNNGKFKLALMQVHGFLSLSGRRVAPDKWWTKPPSRQTTRALSKAEGAEAVFLSEEVAEEPGADVLVETAQKVADGGAVTTSNTPLGQPDVCCEPGSEEVQGVPSSTSGPTAQTGALPKTMTAVVPALVVGVAEGRPRDCVNQGTGRGPRTRNNSRSIDKLVEDDIQGLKLDIVTENSGQPVPTLEVVTLAQCPSKQLSVKAAAMEAAHGCVEPYSRVVAGRGCGSHIVGAPGSEGGLEDLCGQKEFKANEEEDSEEGKIDGGASIGVAGEQDAAGQSDGCLQPAWRNEDQVQAHAADEQDNGELGEACTPMNLSKDQAGVPVGKGDGRMARGAESTHGSVLLPSEEPLPCSPTVVVEPLSPSGAASLVGGQTEEEEVQGALGAETGGEGDLSTTSLVTVPVYDEGTAPASVGGAVSPEEVYPTATSDRARCGYPEICVSREEGGQGAPGPHTTRNLAVGTPGIGDRVEGVPLSMAADGQSSAVLDAAEPILSNAKGSSMVCGEPEKLVEERQVAEAGRDAEPVEKSAPWDHILDEGEAALSTMAAGLREALEEGEVALSKMKRNAQEVGMEERCPLSTMTPPPQMPPLCPRELRSRSSSFRAKQGPASDNKQGAGHGQVVVDKISKAPGAASPSPTPPPCPTPPLPPVPGGVAASEGMVPPAAERTASRSSSGSSKKKCAAAQAKCQVSGNHSVGAPSFTPPPETPPLSPPGWIAQFLESGPRLPEQPEPMKLPRSYWMNKPPQYEEVQKNKYVSRSRPKRLHKEQINVCSCEVRIEVGPVGEPVEVGCGDNCLNRLSYIHCDPRTCPTGDKCRNLPFHLLPKLDLEVFLTENRGYGVRTNQFLATGQFVVEYTGEVINASELQQRMEKARLLGDPHFYIMELMPGYFIDARHKGNFARLLNSSCDPNCETQKWHDAATGEVRIGIFTKREVYPMEELTYDYMFEHYGLSAAAGGFRCRCGAAKCRGTMDPNPERRKDWGRRIEVYWEGDQVYYRGTVIGYNHTTRKHIILYDDGEKEKLSLEGVPHRWIEGDASPHATALEPPPLLAPATKSVLAPATKSKAAPAILKKRSKPPILPACQEEVKVDEEKAVEVEVGTCQVLEVVTSKDPSVNSCQDAPPEQPKSSAELLVVHEEVIEKEEEEMLAKEEVIAEEVQQEVQVICTRRAKKSVQLSGGELVKAQVLVEADVSCPSLIGKVIEPQASLPNIDDVILLLDAAKKLDEPKQDIGHYGVDGDQEGGRDRPEAKPPREVSLVDAANENIRHPPHALTSSDVSAAVVGRKWGRMKHLQVHAGVQGNDGPCGMSSNSSQTTCHQPGPVRVGSDQYKVPTERVHSRTRPESLQDTRWMEAGERPADYEGVEEDDPVVREAGDKGTSRADRGAGPQGSMPAPSLPNKERSNKKSPPSKRRPSRNGPRCGPFSLTNGFGDFPIDLDPALWGSPSVLPALQALVRSAIRPLNGKAVLPEPLSGLWAKTQGNARSSAETPAGAERGRQGPSLSDGPKKAGDSGGRTKGSSGELSWGRTGKRPRLTTRGELDTPLLKSLAAGVPNKHAGPISVVPKLFVSDASLDPLDLEEEGGSGGEVSVDGARPTGPRLPGATKRPHNSLAGSQEPPRSRSRGSYQQSAVPRPFSPPCNHRDETAQPNPYPPHLNCMASSSGPVSKGDTRSPEADQCFAALRRMSYPMGCRGVRTGGHVKGQTKSSNRPVEVTPQWMAQPSLFPGGYAGVLCFDGLQPVPMDMSVFGVRPPEHHLDMTSGVRKEARKQAVNEVEGHIPARGGDIRAAPREGVLAHGNALPSWPVEGQLLTPVSPLFPSVVGSMGGPLMSLGIPLAAANPLAQGTMKGCMYPPMMVLSPTEGVVPPVAGSLALPGMPFAIPPGAVPLAYVPYPMGLGGLQDPASADPRRETPCDYRQPVAGAGKKDSPGHCSGGRQGVQSHAVTSGRGSDNVVEDGVAPGTKEVMQRPECDSTACGSGKAERKPLYVEDAPQDLTDRSDQPSPDDHSLAEGMQPMDVCREHQEPIITGAHHVLLDEAGMEKGAGQASCQVLTVTVQQ